MRELMPEEFVAMWLWREEYARGGLGAIEFYNRLPETRKIHVRDFLDGLRKAQEATSKGGRLHGAVPGVPARRPRRMSDLIQFGISALACLLFYLLGRRHMKGLIRTKFHHTVPKAYLGISQKQPEGPNWLTVKMLQDSYNHGVSHTVTTLKEVFK